MVITASERDRQILETIGQNNGWRLFLAKCWADALQLIKCDWSGVVLVDQELVGFALALLFHPPKRCCVILMTPKAKDDPLCEEFLNGGGYKILQTPLKELEVVNAVRFAWAFWTTRVLHKPRYR